MLKTKNVVIVICMMFLCIGKGCKNNIDNIDKLKESLLENEIKIEEKKINNLNISIQYLPYENLLIHQYEKYFVKKKEIEICADNERIQIINELDSIKKDITRRKEEYSNTVYFKLNIHGNIGKNYELTSRDIDEYKRLLNCMNFGLTKFIVMIVSENKTQPLIFSSIERTEDANSNRRILLAFNKPSDEDTKKTKIIKIKIFEFGLKTGNLEFAFKYPFEKQSEIDIK